MKSSAGVVLWSIISRVPTRHFSIDTAGQAGNSILLSNWDSGLRVQTKVGKYRCRILKSNKSRELDTYILLLLFQNQTSRPANASRRDAYPSPETPWRLRYKKKGISLRPYQMDHHATPIIDVIRDYEQSMNKKGSKNVPFSFLSSWLLQAGPIRPTWPPDSWSELRTWPVWFLSSSSVTK
jgi:hypothetical protein